jgi:hypothetical protein
MGDAALLDELLRRQARAHGLATWAAALQEDAPDDATRAELAEEAARLHTFAGMRGAAADVAVCDADDGPLSPLAEAAADAAALRRRASTCSSSTWKSCW